MTGYPSAETIIQTIEDDGYTYIAKPLEIDRVVDLIERGLEFREARLRGDVE
jgi:DNA-binding NtrC family response regulator